MLKNWWTENRWILMKKIFYGTDCVIILLIPVMNPPYSYIGAIFVVISLVMFFKDFNAAYRRTGSDR